MSGGTFSHIVAHLAVMAKAPLVSSSIVYQLIMLASGFFCFFLSV